MAPEEAAAASELRTRIASAAVLGSAALIAGIIGGLFFAAAVTLVAAIAYWEWASITAPLDSPWPRAVWLALLIAGLIGLATLEIGWVLTLIGGPALFAIVVAIIGRADRWTSFGFVYVLLPSAAFIVLRQAEPAGWAAILFILIVVWATDTAAFFGGRAFGGPKLWPRISPQKTWAGALSGLAAAIAAGGLTVLLTRTGDLRAGLLLAVPLSIAAQAGDLFESAIKRRFGVKDSGSIIPGHGGVLDRVDGLFGAAAVGWLIAAVGLGGSILRLPTNAVSVAGGGS